MTTTVAATRVAKVPMPTHILVLRDHTRLTAAGAAGSWRQSCWALGLRRPAPGCCRQAGPWGREGSFFMAYLPKWGQDGKPASSRFARFLRAGSDRHNTRD